MDLEQQMTGSKLALHHAQQQMIRLKSIIEHYQVCGAVPGMVLYSHTLYRTACP